MPNEKKHIEEIISLITTWITKIALSNASNFYDINKASEGTCQQLLNLIYDYELADLNELKVNFPGIDLGDIKKSKIAFQITSRTDWSKIKHSLRLFYENGLHKRFTGGIKFLILNNYKSRLGKLGEFEGGFDPKKDVIYPRNLIQAITAVYRSDFERFLKIKEFLNREFSNYEEHSEAKSLFGHLSAEGQIDHYRNLFSHINSEKLSRFVHFFCTVDGMKSSTEFVYDKFFKNAGG